MEQGVVSPPGLRNQEQSAEPLPPEVIIAADSQEDSQRQKTAKEYSRTKIALGITGATLFFALTLVFVVSGLSGFLDNVVHRYTQNDYLALLLFAACFGIAETVLASPLSYYSGYYLEHKYHLSNQSFRGWIWEGLKGMLVGIPLGVPILLAFYFCLKTFGPLWWLPVGSVLFFFSVILARLAPVLIFPLFYKFVPLQEGTMRDRILTLCSKVGVRVEGIFTFDLSKNTKKANAAFTGIGKTKRIILGDTLVQNFNDDEIETVFAHELGHFKMKHIWITMAMGTVNSFLGLFLTAYFYERSLPWFAFGRADQLGAFPLLTLWLGVYSLLTSPVSNRVSRALEFAADRYAVRTTHNKEAFVNALKKLARVNLADTAPPPIIEFLFHSHPSIDKRIRTIESAELS
jgi:STE24 endopeptidase